MSIFMAVALKKDSNNKIYMIAINCQSFPNCIAAMQLLTVHNTIIVDFKTAVKYRIRQVSVKIKLTLE